MTDSKTSRKLERRLIRELIERGGAMSLAVARQLERRDLPDPVRIALREALIEWDETVMSVPEIVVSKQMHL